MLILASNRRIPFAVVCQSRAGRVFGIWIAAVAWLCLDSWAHSRGCNGYRIDHWICGAIHFLYCSNFNLKRPEEYFAELKPL